MSRCSEMRQERDQARAERDQLRDVLASLVDPDDCRFDRNGGCQAHGFLYLYGEVCPNEWAKTLLNKP